MSIISTFHSLHNMMYSFQNSINSTYSPNSFFSKNIVVQKYKLNENKLNELNVIRVWRSNYIFGYRLDDMDYDNLIGGIDYRVNKDNIKIEYLSINDKEYATLMNHNKYLSDDETTDVRQSFIKYTENIAKENNISKIVKDVHGNLRLYNKEFLPEGFINTNRRCSDNPFWVESEKTI